ncbi:MAG: hypothetical protein E6Q98_15410 [Rhodospirillaceae bacterium]|nr:MAG: hypothetical protein E6Q98_15410 [Rhodospirillaceae bacterium]
MKLISDSWKWQVTGITNDVNFVTHLSAVFNDPAASGTRNDHVWNGKNGVAAPYGERPLSGPG